MFVTIPGGATSYERASVRTQFFWVFLMLNVIIGQLCIKLWLPLSLFSAELVPGRWAKFGVKVSLSSPCFVDISRRWLHSNN